jgi:integrase
VKGHLRERSPGHWAIVIDSRDPATGKRQRRWHSFRGGKRGAQIECSRLISDQQRGTYLEPSKLTVAAFLAHWLKDVRPRVSPRTFERYEEICNKNIIPLLGAAHLTKLRPAQISTAWAQAATDGHRMAPGGLSNRTINHLHTVLKTALQQAVRWELLSRNPCEAVRPPKVERSMMATYDLAQTVELLEASRGSRIYAAVALAVLAGLRRGEIAALRWGQVDLANGQLAVTHSAEQTRAGVRYKPPKSGKSRTVAISSTLIEELRAHRTQQAEGLLRLGVRLTDDTFVCALEDGAPIRPNTLTIYWVRLLAKTTLPRVRFHDLRHAHATHLLASGVHPKVASERLGHSKVGITLDLYSHVLPGMQADAAALVDDALQAAMRRHTVAKR